MDWGEFYRWLKGKLTFQLFIVGITAGLMAVAYLASRKATSSSSTHGKRAIALAEDRRSISPVFARAPYFKIDGEIVENPYREEAAGAGPKVAEFIAGFGVSEVVAGGFGPLALRRLEELGIRAVRR